MRQNARSFSASAVYGAQENYKLLVVGGGAGGCSVSAKFANKLDSVAVIEPADVSAC